MLTIIIPVYNAEKTIKKTLDSLLTQKNQNFSVIIINDGSTDSSEEIINHVIKDNPKFLYISQPNKGVSYTRNKGISMAKTEYIAFLDSDDMYLKNYVAQFYKSISKRKLDLLTYRNPRKSRKQVSRLTHYNYLKHKNTPDTNCWIINKNIIVKNNLKFNENISWGEDMLFFYQVLFCSKKIMFVNEVMTQTNDTQHSLSKVEYSNFEEKFIWLKEIKKFSNDDKINNIVDGYLTKGTVLASLRKGEIKKKEALKNIKFVEYSNGFRTIKQNILLVKQLL